ncbi:MAG: dihydrofolate reductase [Candidatus Cohnella colombiensis]|uniref:Dihydrofolate reductase n=1 Tax=Candidatus Cohnella colombiensis TaxID=3121368 RepID=A0AA95JHB5_9BACL|nr:MAG: dihydrofolate reductase [Cohnella sp.]
MTVTLIAAVAANGVIGIHNELPWRLPADMAFFKQQTIGKPILMGRKTFESLKRPLKDRTNVILSRTMTAPPDGCELVHSISDAIERHRDEEIMVIGGAEIYAQVLPFADRMILTEIEQSFEGDAYFPSYDRSEWKLVSKTPGIVNDANLLSHSFCVYERASTE